ncbi:hypothetical protein M3936_23445 [Sutcliffiella horikoshii]|uniref:hypothetical protein n=1 Tax=Sutcliffiella horikoshii TaxID=79883 RepID=UPI0020424215|nr:hypothetical protein [Sutcliffiella horikoshii]MCM3620514.1 hypothetical protein [Sutcliffiella horikoshii]
MRNSKYDYDNCIGKTYNQLTFVKEIDRIKGKPRRFVCECVCGTEKVCYGIDVMRGHTKSCGCLQKQKLLERNEQVNPVKYKVHESKYPYDECIGTTINNLFFVKEIKRSKYGRRQFIVRCECGNEFPCEGVMVFNGSIRSCGCFKRNLGERNKTHGLTKTPEYQIWASMIQRCINPNDESYVNYGGRGIKVCDRWLDFYDFIMDMGYRTNPEYTIERIDVNGDYEPSNCIWDTRIVQSRNQRLRSDNTTGIRGVTKSGKKYLVRISVEGRRKTIGSFDTLEQAKRARKKAEIKYWN